MSSPVFIVEMAAFSFSSALRSATARSLSASAKSFSERSFTRWRIDSVMGMRGQPFLKSISCSPYFTFVVPQTYWAASASMSSVRSIRSSYVAYAW